MKKQVKVGKDIIPNPDNLDFEDFNDKVLKRFDITITFLFENGLIVEYDDSKFDSKFYPGDFSLYDVKTKCRILTILNNFGYLDFYGPGIYEDLEHEDAIYTIETLY